MNRNLREVRLLEPELCIECRFGRNSIATKPDGTKVRLVHCTRRDCDNWDYSINEPLTSVEDQ